MNNKDDCLKLHHVGYLINRVMMHGTTNIRFYSFLTTGNLLRATGNITLFIQRYTPTLTKRGFDDVEWIHLAQDRVKWYVL